jgi:hypothetical protein
MSSQIVQYTIKQSYFVKACFKLSEILAPKLAYANFSLAYANFSFFYQNFEFSQKPIT